MLIAWVASRPLMRESSAHVDVDRSRYPVKGIDVSSHNGAVNYARVAADTVSFVLAKASEGVSFRDKKFVMNIESARRQGLRTGAYHFLRFDTPGFRQAQNFLRAVDGVVLDFPLIIDVEEWRNAETFTTAEVVAELREMIDCLNEAGRKVMIYTNKSGYDRFIRFRFDDLPLWVCSLRHEPATSVGWAFWQHSHKGHVPGVVGDVDLNTFNGDNEEFLDFLFKNT